MQSKVVKKGMNQVDVDDGGGWKEVVPLPDDGVRIIFAKK